MKFAKNQVYNFAVSRMMTYNGEAYFVLNYNGSETMPGYAAEGWVFRTRVLPHQEDWSQSEMVGRVLPCYVQRYYVNEDAVATDFPVLVQDLHAVLRSKYTEGLSYDFLVISCPGEADRNGNLLTGYLLEDSYRLRHFLPGEKGTYRKGETLKLRVRNIEANRLVFEQPRLSLLPQSFNVGAVYEFEICDEAQTPDGRSNYFIVRDKALGLLHRYYLREEHEESVGDTMLLRVKGFTDKGWMVLEDPTGWLDSAEFRRIAALEDEESLGKEGPKLEYKSSFVYTRNGEADIDRQLGFDLMRHVAGFMNSEGGLLCIGYRDDGTICGINEDLRFINSGSEDDYHYELSEDKIKLKFINTIARTLGALAASRVKIELLQNSRGRLVCFLHVSPSSRPVWYRERDLFIRCFNTSRCLRGSEITDFICERCGVKPPEEDAPPAASLLPLPLHSEEVSPLPPEHLLQVSIAMPDTEGEKMWRYISLYADGSAS